MLNRVKRLLHKSKTLFLLVGLAHVLPALYLMWIAIGNDSVPGVKYFPLHPEYIFETADSYLSIKEEKGETYVIRLDTISQTNHPAYLRQDISLLFQDGILIAQNHDWIQDADTLIHSLEHRSRYNHLFEAVTYHHAEFHDPGGEESDITIQQAMSSDYLYVASSKFGGTHHFHHPQTEKKIRWKEVIDRGINNHLLFEWRQAMKEFDIDQNEYFMIPLTRLPSYGVKEDLPAIAGEKQAEVIGNLWEGLYHEYVLGQSGDPASPPSSPADAALGSGIPLILIDKKGDHIRVIYRGSDGKYHQLYQRVSTSALDTK